MILSTAADAVISEVARIFGVSSYVCTQLELSGGFYSGRLVGDIVYGEKKLEYIKKYFEVNDLKLSEAVAYADHKSDISLLKSVGNGYIVNPSVHLLRLAQKNGLGIIETR
jgi:phosphoserine phosphatase